MLEEHKQLLRTAAARQEGTEIDAQGDGLFVAFRRPVNAVAARSRDKRRSPSMPGRAGVSVRVRMGMHTGEALRIGRGYVGLDVHRAARIRAAGHGGQILISETTHEHVFPAPPSQTGFRELGLHRLKDLQRPERLFQVIHPKLTLEFPPLRSLDSRPHNLTGFVGRQRELEELRTALPASRLLTLTGSAGCGKTRLALQVAAEVLDDYPDGVWLVELASLSDPDLTAQAVATTLGVRERPGHDLLTSLDHLVARRSLLILDNCEHLVAACARQAKHLLGACPKLQILATSREPLGVMGERVFVVPPLTVPDLTRLPAPEALAVNEAVRLFIERAVANAPFELTDRNAPAVAQVVQRLDGIPLAIELAAARTRTLSVMQIASRLDNRFSLLTRGGRAEAPRQQTLRAAIDWSHELLSEKERRLFRRLAVFSGGFSLEVVESICTDDVMHKDDILDVLANLVDKSLVVVEEQENDLRYRLLETVRQYSSDRLEESGETQIFRDRHLQHFLGFAADAEPHLTGPDQGEWLARLERDNDNLRAALDWSLTGPEPDTRLRLAGALWRFWETRGYLSEGRKWLDRVLARDQLGQISLRARVLYAAGGLATRQGDYGRAVALCEESLALYRQAGDRRGIADTLNGLGVLAFDQGDYPRARLLPEESLAIRRDLADHRGLAASLNNLGLVATQQSDYVAARRSYEEALQPFQGAGDRRGVAIARANLGLVARYQADYTAAHSHCEAALRTYEDLNDRWGVGLVLGIRGFVRSGQGDYVGAGQDCERSLAIRREIGDKWGTAMALAGLGFVALSTAMYDQAEQYFAGALDIQRNLDDRHAAAHTLNGWGDVARVRGSFDLARDRCVESLARFREVNDRRGEAYALESLGQVASDQGDGGAARPLFEESLTIFRDLDNPQGAANVLTDLALLGIRERDITTAASLAQEALSRFQRCGDAAGRGDALYALGRATAGAELLLDSLRLRVQVGDRRGIAECLETLGTVACARSQYTWAARLWGLA